ncbi:hypothetical protein HYC85_020343 [Camellia sinensis]|uniref:Uncharacterized protein n=1 Tax=Camellia sinensis TaxID=4442 RepID=A0A7J7GRY9_CAMSI|nr:hypothetical protein HYC85_020343 [Camellia sinensis]
MFFPSLISDKVSPVTASVVPHPHFSRGGRKGPSQYTQRQVMFRSLIKPRQKQEEDKRFRFSKNRVKEKR